MTLLPGNMPAEERVAAFLLKVSEPLAKLAHSAYPPLRITREEIGSLLGIDLDTVSRILSKFQKDALIEIDGEHLSIVSIEGLRAVVAR